jgi:hypothetical protein
MRKRRLSIMSASAPAGSANRKSGRLAATCTSDTVSGSESKLVIGQAAAALYIQPPVLETTVAVQMTAYVRCRKGAQTRGGPRAIERVVMEVHASELDGRSPTVAARSGVDAGDPCHELRYDGLRGVTRRKCAAPISSSVLRCRPRCNGPRRAARSQSEP